MSEILPGALSDYGWTDRVLALFSALERPDLHPARITRVERSACFAVFTDGAERVLYAHDLPAVGDWVAASGERVEAVLPRWSALSRLDPMGREQILAADLDLVLITVPSDRPSVARAERELTMAWDSGAVPVVLVTKADLESGELVGEMSDRLVGVEVIATSAADGLGVDEVRERLRPSRTAVMLGPSGAGKSSLVNALAGHPVMATGEVRDTDSRGRHTTSSRQLVVLPGGGVLIDTPGLRSLGLPASTGLDAAYPDIEELAAGCRFRDCRHGGEPGCSVVEAAEGGSLDSERLAGFRKLQKELAAEVRRTDPVVRKQELARWKSIQRSVRAVTRDKDRRG